MSAPPDPAAVALYRTFCSCCGAEGTKHHAPYCDDVPLAREAMRQEAEWLRGWLNSGQREAGICHRLNEKLKDRIKQLETK